MKSSDSTVTEIKVSDVRKSLKTMSKNELVRACLYLSQRNAVLVQKLKKKENENEA